MRLLIQIIPFFGVPVEPFTFVMPVADAPDEASQRRLLDWLFRELNRTDTGDRLIDVANVPMPSMSEGDTVVFTVFDSGGSIMRAKWKCEAGFGWNEIVEVAE